MNDAQADDQDASGLPPYWPDEQIARRLKMTLKVLADNCLPDEPVSIEKVIFRPYAVLLSIRWPFIMPTPANDSGEWFDTAGTVKRFRKELRAYLMENHAGRPLSNVLYEDFVEYLKRFIGVHRHGGRVVKRIGTVSERRLAGRPEGLKIPGKLRSEMRKDGTEVYNVVRAMRQKIRTWSLKAEDTKVIRRLGEHFNRDEYPWMRDFREAVKRLPRQRRFRVPCGVEKEQPNESETPMLARPDSWSAIDLARQIIQEMYYRQTGTRYPLSAIAEHVKAVHRI